MERLFRPERRQRQAHLREERSGGHTPRPAASRHGAGRFFFGIVCALQLLVTSSVFYRLSPARARTRKSGCSNAGEIAVALASEH